MKRCWPSLLVLVSIVRSVRPWSPCFLSGLCKSRIFKSAMEVLLVVGASNAALSPPHALASNPSEFASYKENEEVFNEFRDQKQSLLNDPRFLLPSVNFQSDDFWYPPFLIGRWKADIAFDYIELHPRISHLSRDALIRSFPVLSSDLDKIGSLIFLPSNVGDEIPTSRADAPLQLFLRFVQLDGHVREDHPFNLRQFVQFFSRGKLFVDSAKYSFQKQPNWLVSPSNRWNIEYHLVSEDQELQERGKAGLQTLKRLITSEPGFVETTEFFRQVTERAGATGGRPSVSRSLFARNLQLGVESSLRKEFIGPSQLAAVDTVFGKLNYLLYFSPEEDSYVSSELGSRPAVAISYRLKLTRDVGPREPVGASQEGGRETWSASPRDREGLLQEEVRKSSYPYLPRRGVGPVELQDFFGY